MLSDSTVVVLITSISVLLGLIAKLLYSSKCKRTMCCFGCCEVDREPTLEQVINISSNMTPK